MPQSRIGLVPIHDRVDNDQRPIFTDAVEDANTTHLQLPASAKVAAKLSSGERVGIQQQERVIHFVLTTIRECPELIFSYSFETYLWQVLGLS
jgi:hypothetical protein